MENTLQMFSEYQDHYQAELDMREKIKEAVQNLDQTAREMVAIMQGIHQKANDENINLVCCKLAKHDDQIKQQIGELAALIPVGQYYRYHEQWKCLLQKLVFLNMLIYYLTNKKLLTREEAAAKLGVKLKWNEGFHLDLDDYLIGILNLASELSRLAPNAVIIGDYIQPVQIASFLSEIDAAFRLLNLKNDFLRKRFDVLKYDLKKVEEVVYDLSIRGLKPASD